MNINWTHPYFGVLPFSFGVIMGYASALGLNHTFSGCYDQGRQTNGEITPNLPFIPFILAQTKEQMIKINSGELEALAIDTRSIAEVVGDINSDTISFTRRDVLYFSPQEAQTKGGRQITFEGILQNQAGRYEGIWIFHPNEKNPLEILGAFRLQREL